jgi:hypothetical protein
LGSEFRADLRESGLIEFEGQSFKSPSSFSIHCKRKLNPSKRADDGWLSVTYEGRSLKQIHVGDNAPVRQRKRAADAAGAIGAAGQSPSKRQRNGEGAAASKKRKRRRRRSASDEDDDDDGNGAGESEGGADGGEGGEDPLTLLEPSTYGRGVEQPFTLVVPASVNFLIDLHAHLVDTEVIGLLGGRWDPASRLLHVQIACPCRGLETHGAREGRRSRCCALTLRAQITA